MGDAAGAAVDAQAVLDSPLPRSLHTEYQVQQLLCRLSFGSGLYEEAGERVQALLKLCPQDAWVAQFQVAAQCEVLIQAEERPDEAGLADLRQRYEQAIRLNKGETWVVSDYLGYLSRLAGAASALEAGGQLRQAYPEHGNLVYLHGIHQSRAGNAEAAAQTMLDALGLPDGVRNRDELYEIFNLALDGLGLEKGEQALMDAPIQEGSAPGSERRRALGLALAKRDPSRVERARELLRVAVQTDAEDGLAWMRLGDVAESDEEQETCYRRALMAAPHWDFARANLARFLVHIGRPNDALEFTSGYESRSQDVLVAHGQALIGVGYYEEAAGVIGRAIAGSQNPGQACITINGTQKWSAAGMKLCWRPHARRRSSSRTTHCGTFAWRGPGRAGPGGAGLECAGNWPAGRTGAASPAARDRAGLAGAR